MKIRSKYTCPLELALDLVSGKWKPIILWRLRLGAQPLSVLQRDIHGISQKMLLQHLGELLVCGIIGKNTHAGYPLKVEYFLTDRGRDFIAGLAIFQGIGQKMLQAGPDGKLMGELQAAEQKYPAGYSQQK